MTEAAPVDGGRPRLRPGGRSERVREAVARACLELLTEGHIDLSPADVAARSGVSRTTVYRWWPTMPDLLREALAFHTRRLDPPDTGTWFGDVHALIAQLAEFFSDPVERAQNSIMASGQHPVLTTFLLEYYQPITEAWIALVSRGIERGEVSSDVSPTAVVQLLVSPLLVTTVIERRSPTVKELSDLAHLVIRATATNERTNASRADQMAPIRRRPRRASH